MNKAEVVLVRDNVAWDDLGYLSPKEDPEQDESWSVPMRMMSYEGFRLLRCEVVRTVRKHESNGTLVREDFMTEAEALRAEHAVALEAARAEAKAQALADAVAVVLEMRAAASDRYISGDAPSGTHVEWDTLGDAAAALLELSAPHNKKRK